MFQLMQFPSDALPDVRALVQLSAEQLIALAVLLDAKDATPPIDQEFEDSVANALELDAKTAESVVRLSLILQTANLDTEMARLGITDFIQLVNSENPPDRDALLRFIEEKQSYIADVITRKPAITRELHRRIIASGDHPTLESLRTIVQLRPLFKRNKEKQPVDIECMVPAMTLELNYKRNERKQSVTFSVTEETLRELIESLQEAKSKWALLREKYADHICD